MGKLAIYPLGRSVMAELMDITRWVYLFLGLLLFSNLSAQELHVTGFTSGTEVRDIAGDEDHIWVAHYWGGITRIDRATGNLTHYHIANSNLPSNDVTSVVIDHDGVVWAGTRHGLARFDNGDWFVYRLNNSPLGNSPFISALMVDEDNNKWIGTAGNSLWRFDGVFDWELFSPGNSGLPNSWVSSLALHQDGSVWIGTGLEGAFGEGLVKFDGTNWTVYTTGNSGLLNNAITFVEVAPNGDVWAGMVGGLSRFDGQFWSSLKPADSPLVSPLVNALTFTSDGYLWIGSAKGLQLFDGITWQNYTMNNAPIPGNRIGALYISEDEALWVGHQNAIRFEDQVNIDTLFGLSRLNGAEWTSYFTGGFGLPNNWITDIQFDTLDQPWFASYSGGIAQYDGTGWDWYHIGNSAIPGSYVNSLVVDDQDRKWMAIDGYGLVRKSGNQWSSFTPDNSLFPSYYPSTLAMAPDGALLIGTLEGDLVKYQNNTWTIFEAADTPMPASTIRHILVGQNNNVWISTAANMGLYKYDGIIWSTFNTSNSQIPSNTINTLAEDEAGNLWVGTGTGLGRYNGMAWTVFNMSNSLLPSNRILSIAVHQGNKLWVSTAKGFLHYDGVGDWILYPDLLDGQSSFDDEVLCMTVAPDEKIWIGTHTGVLVLEPFTPVPELQVSLAEILFDTTFVGSCTTRSYMVEGAALQGELNISAPDGFSLAVHPDSSFMESLVLSPSSGVLMQEIYVRFCPLEENWYNGMVLHQSVDLADLNLPVMGQGVKSVSVDETGNFKGVRIASNPTDGDLYLYPEGDFSDEVFQLSWLDMEGRLLDDKTVLFNSQQGPIHFDVHRWAPGIYILRISQGNEVRIYKIVKH